MPRTACRVAMSRILLVPRRVLHTHSIRPTRRLDGCARAVKLWSKLLGGTRMDRLKGKVAVVTGAASGIGRASAKLFAAEGAKVVCVDRAKDVEDTAKAIKDPGGVALALVADASSEKDIANAVDTAVKDFGKLDILYANAGISGGGQPPFFE